MNRYSRITEDSYSQTYALVEPEVTQEAKGDGKLHDIEIYDTANNRKVADDQMTGKELSDDISIKEYMMQHGLIKGEMSEISVIYNGNLISISDKENESSLYNIKIKGKYEGKGQPDNVEQPDLLSSAVYTTMNRGPKNTQHGSG